MSLPFAGAVTDAFVMKKATWLVLGDPGHGKLSLDSLANAIQAGVLNPKTLGLKTVLFEGAKLGEELIAEGGKYKDTVNALRAKEIIVLGCEDSNTLQGAKVVEGAMQLAVDGKLDAETLNKLSIDALDSRIPVANTAWAAVAKRVAAKVVICCGTSHVPKYFRPGDKEEAGLKDRLGSQCIGYALAAPNDPSVPDTYFPEWNGTGAKLFGGVAVISAYP